MLTLTKATGSPLASRISADPSRGASPLDSSSCSSSSSTPPSPGFPNPLGTWRRPPSPLNLQKTDRSLSWLIAKGRIPEAEQILADLEDSPVDDPRVQSQSRDIQWAVVHERENAVPWSDLLRGRVGAGTSVLRRLLLGIGTQAMQQLSGINVTSYYLPTVLISSVGLDNRTARLLAACNSVSYFLFSLIGIPNVEKWGRRKMMMCK